MNEREVTSGAVNVGDCVERSQATAWPVADQLETITTQIEGRRYLQTAVKT